VHCFVEVHCVYHNYLYVFSEVKRGDVKEIKGILISIHLNIY
jgi:hypothetical protein